MGKLISGYSLVAFFCLFSVSGFAAQTIQSAKPVTEAPRSYEPAQGEVIGLPNNEIGIVVKSTQRDIDQELVTFLPLLNWKTGEFATSWTFSLKSPVIFESDSESDDDSLDGYEFSIGERSAMLRVPFRRRDYREKVEFQKIDRAIPVSKAGIKAGDIVENKERVGKVYFVFASDKVVVQWTKRGGLSLGSYSFFEMIPGDSLQIVSQ